jgi:hypothetical protein
MEPPRSSAVDSCSTVRSVSGRRSRSSINLGESLPGHLAQATGPGCSLDYNLGGPSAMF